jgi:ABC-2 type transport system permease protein
MSVETATNKLAWWKRGPHAIRENWAALRQNPIILKELRYRMRSWRGLVDLGFYTLLLSVVGLITYGTVSNSDNYYYYNIYYGAYSGINYNTRSQETGTNYFTAIVIAQLFLVCVLAPGFSATTIAGEKERQTYDVLLVTLLRPRDIVFGKLFAALAYLLLVIVAGIPVASVAFLMGGISFDQLGMALVTMLVTSLMVGTVGIFWSSLVRTSREANRYTFWSLLVLIFGLPLSIFFGLSAFFSRYVSLGVVFYSDTIARDIVSWILSINPMYAVLTTSEILKTQADSNIFFFFSESGGWYLTPFVRFLILALLISVIFTWQAIRHIKPVRTQVEGQALFGGKKKQKASNNANTR